MSYLLPVTFNLNIIFTYFIMEVTEAYLNQTYEVFATEQMKLMQGLKATDDEEKQKKVPERILGY